MKSYFDLEGDGGSKVIDQVLAQRAQIKNNLAGVKNLVAIGSGKGGVGKSTLTMQLAFALRKKGKKVSLFDADLNGPSLARLSGLRNAPMLPGKNQLIVPKNSAGIGVVSLGSMISEDEVVDFASVSEGDSHVWRATKEFSVMAQFLANTAWGELDFLIIDLPPGVERCVQFAEFFGAETQFILVTIPSDLSRGIVGRSVLALKSKKNPVLGFVENMSGYWCPDCKSLKPLFSSVEHRDWKIPCLGSIPFDPLLAQLSDCGRSLFEEDQGLTSPVYQSLNSIADKVLVQTDESCKKRTMI